MRLARVVVVSVVSVVAFALAALSGCATVNKETAATQAPWRRPPRAVDPDSIVVRAIEFADDQAYAYFDGNTGRELSFDEVLTRARASQVVVVGEQHDQASHHELQRRMVAALAAEAPGSAVGLEMLTWNLQEPLDRFNVGEIDADALAAAVDWPNAWGFPFEMYKPIFVDGHAAGARFVALNAPRELVKAVRKKGVDGLDADEVRALPDLDLGDVLHRAWFKSIFAKGGHPVSDSDLDSFYTAQVVWDESMADRVSRALDDGAPRVFVIAGIGHVAQGRGIPERVERRKPGVRVLSMVPLTDVDGENAQEKLKAAIVEGEGDILVVPRFEEAIAL